MLKHTKPVWDHFSNPDGSCSIEVVSGEQKGLVVAVLPVSPLRDQESQFADGRLLTAAPDLLASAMACLGHHPLGQEIVGDFNLEWLRRAVCFALTGTTAKLEQLRRAAWNQRSNTK